MKALIVGDPHLQHQKKDDAEEFLLKLEQVAEQDGVESIILLGDLFHTFAVVRSEVLSLWNEFFRKVEDRFQVWAIVGNHDYAGQSGGSHALEVFKTRINVIQSKVHSHGIYWMPFYRDNEKFIEDAKAIPAGSVLFCHQSFTGAQFENGFFDPHGVDPACVSHLGRVISGHIHRQQKIQNVWYPGTPFQHSFAEAGQEKRVFTIDLSPTGYTLIKEHDLDLPQFITIEAPGSVKVAPIPDGLLSVLPDPNPRHSYRFVGRATPLEIAAFWKDPKAKAFRSKARRVVDALIPERGQVDLPGSDGKNQKEKLDGYIRSKKWRTPTDQLIKRAAACLFE